jgi:hypothetical protein
MTAHTTTPVPLGAHKLAAMADAAEITQRGAHTDDHQVMSECRTVIATEARAIRSLIA